jgi:hypothetical protein
MLVIYYEKMRATVALLLAFASTAVAQDADKTRDALEWTVALRTNLNGLAVVEFMESPAWPA